MAKKSKSVLKRARQADKKRIQNRLKKQRLKKLLKSIKSMKTKEELQKHLPKTQATIDKSARIGIIHRNTAARMKSKLMKKQILEKSSK